MAFDWIVADWPVPENIVAGSTIRDGGVSKGHFHSLNLGAYVGDDPETVVTNRNRFVRGCEIESQPRWLRQVHGNSVTDYDSIDTERAVEADGMTGHSAGSICAVLTADCLPVIFCSNDGRHIGAAHAGWRGLAAGILEATVAELRVDPGQLLAWFGPAISADAFEVGGEVREAFVKRAAEAEQCFVANESGRFQADLYGLARQRLGALGVTNIYGGDHCTYRDSERFFSYRRDGATGRMASFVHRRN